MQLMLPIFPVSTKLITGSLGVYTQDGIITYIHCGMPIFTHSEEDLENFRYITSKFILMGLCSRTEISEVFCVSYDSVNRYANRLKELGEKKFFTNDGRKGHAHKLLAQVLQKAQKGLDDGKSNSLLAKELQVTEGAIRYAIKTGKLKKKE